MRSSSTLIGSFLARLIVLAVVVCPAIQGAMVFDYGSSWRYRLGTSEASNPVGEWREVTFNDGAWGEGATPLGYSTSPGTPIEQSIVTTLPTSGEANYTSVFLRKEFTMNSPAGVEELVLNVNVDDGFIAWINGTEVARFNVPAGDLAYDARASSANEPTLEQITLTQNLAQILRTGENVLAIQLFNGNTGSSDLVIDVSLSSSLDEEAPRLVGLSPASGSVVRDLTAIEMTFSESVKGVDAGDLLINGAAATGVNENSPINYSFTFPQPADGQVQVAWAANHQITDYSPAANAFAGGSWSYTLNPNIPPATVVISEFLADNENGIRDNDGVRSDWLELQNKSAVAAPMDGWYLTDDPSDLMKWRIPAISIPANGYYLIWASGNDRTSTVEPLHTNFRLSKDASYLALVDPDGNVVSAFEPTYPDQREDISYGRDSVEADVVGFFEAPTPGQRNNTAGSGFAPAPEFSVAEGVFTSNSVSVAITAASGQIRYTLDGSVPTTSSPVYTSPITISTTTTLKARVFQTGLLPSRVVAGNYVMVDTSARNFSSNLPLLFFSTGQRSIADHPPQGAPGTFTTVLAIEPFQGRSRVMDEPHFSGQGEISIRGQTSAGFPKKPYRVELQDEFRNDRAVGLFGMPAEADWVLVNPYSDKPFIQNFLAQELYEKMGHYAVRRRFVEVFVNTAGGKIAYPRDYMGLYLLVEKIEVGDDRVNIAKLRPEHTSEPEISGGYMFKKDKDTSGDLNFSTQGGAGFSGQTLKIHEPKPEEITSQQITWLRNYLNRFEQALYSPNWLTATGPNHYSHYIDVDSFVDQHWIVEFSKQIDGYRLSNYMHKDRGGKLKMSPIWDWNLSFGNADYLEGEYTSGWYYSLLGATEHIWLRRLISGTTSAGGSTGDPDFNQKIVDRWSVLRTNVFAKEVVLARVDELEAMLTEAAQRDFNKWPRLGNYVWPNPRMYVTPTTYAGIIDAMKGWISGRFDWIDSQFLKSPGFSRQGGRVASGTTLNISSSGGEIYYTRDGSDPRASGGGISPKAVRYLSPVAVGENSRIVARVRSGNRWSGPTAATFVVSPTALALTEVMYHPAEPVTGAVYEDNDFEFLEFMNGGSEPLALGGYRIAEGVEFTFPSMTLEPGGRVAVVKNRAAFESLYGTEVNIAGEFTGNLSNQGERLTVLSALEEVLIDFEYETEWHRITDGAGFALVLSDESARTADLNHESSWRAGSEPGGTPGMAEAAAAAFPRVVVNELVNNPLVGGVDQVELWNASNVPANVGGWYLSDNRSAPTKFQIPGPAIIPAGGYLVLDESDFGAAFGFGADGEEVYLFAAHPDGTLGGYMHGFTFGAQAAGVSFGRVVDSAGGEHFASQTAPTFGAANAGPLAPPVVISEIHYHPPDVSVNGQMWNNTHDEYIEVFNKSAEAVQLGGWELAGEAEFVVPANTELAEGAYAVVVSFDPARDAAYTAAFRSRHGVPSGVAVLGPFSGALNNGGATISLRMPNPVAGRPAVAAEEVRYAPGAPWPGGANGLGFTLQRVDAAGFGGDPGNWVARAGTAGRATSQGATLAITQQPKGALALAGETVRLEVGASGSGTVSYQWRRNGEIVAGATEAALTLNDAQAEESGLYDVVVSTAAESISSEPASVWIAGDSDGDGMADDWEFAHGFSPFAAADAEMDLDGDGMSNREEFVAGTNPVDGASYFEVTQARAGGEFEVEFEAAADRPYVVEYTESLRTPDWKVLAEIPAAPGRRTAVAVDASGAANRYYRIVAGQR